MRKQYFVLSRETCTFNKDTCHWTIDLPRDFVSSAKPKSITVLNFMYYGCYVLNEIIVDTGEEDKSLQGYQQLDYTSFHCPTLLDGNVQQNDYYIASLCYQYNTVYKTFPIMSHAEKLEFWFKTSCGMIVKQFDLTPEEHGNTDKPIYSNCDYEERFVIELELSY